MQSRIHRDDAAAVSVSRLRRSLPDVLAVVWVIAAGIAVLAPALVQGAGIYNVGNADDFVDTIVPWSILGWREVHHGSLPLWNPYSALGTPLSFNWHSLTFSVPSLVAYLFPLRLDIAVQLVLTVVIAGTGVYVLCRVLGLGLLACAFAATAFELSGPFVGYLGLPTAEVMAWGGWLFAAALLVLRGERRARHIAGFAVVLACTVYSSQPPLLAQLLLALALFLAVVLALRFRTPAARANVLGAVRDMGMATLAGLALAAPLLLPGLQLLRGSINGLPGVATNDDQVTAAANLFYEANKYEAYLGAMCVILAILGLVVRRRRPDVVAFGVVSALAALCSLAPPVLDLLHRTPLLREADWSRAMLIVALGVAVLGATGVDALVAPASARTASRWATAAFGLLAFGVLLVYLFGSGHIDPADAAVRTRTLAWRGAEAGVGLVVCVALAWRFRRGADRVARERRWGHWLRPASAAAFALLACETVTLMVAGQPEWLSSSTSVMPWSPDPAIAAFQKAVGPALVGFGENGDCFPGSLGILQDINITYKVHELAVYDRSAPAAYLQLWKKETGRSAYTTGATYCPAVTSASIARLYGVSLVVEPKGAPGPVGGVFVGDAGYSQLYSIPGAAAAVVVPLTPGRALPAAEAPGTPVRVTYPDYGTWRVDADADSASVLRLHLTDVPGWHASIDGRPLALTRFAGIMLQARIPAGRHVIMLSYSPATFSVGLVLAGCAVVALVTTPVVLASRSRRRASIGRSGQRRW